MVTLLTTIDVWKAFNDLLKFTLISNMPNKSAFCSHHEPKQYYSVFKDFSHPGSEILF